MTTAGLRDLPSDVRHQIAGAIRHRGQGLTADLTAVLTAEPGLDWAGWHTCSHVLVDLFAAATDDGQIDDRRGGIQDLSRLSPPLTTRQIVHAVHFAELILVDELALHEQLGVTSEPWPIVAHAV